MGLNNYHVFLYGYDTTIFAHTKEEAVILAQAEAIKLGLNYKVSYLTDSDGNKTFYCIICHKHSVDLKAGMITCNHCSISA